VPGPDRPPPVRGRRSRRRRGPPPPPSNRPAPRSVSAPTNLVTPYLIRIRRHRFRPRLAPAPSSPRAILFPAASVSVSPPPLRFRRARFGFAATPSGLATPVSVSPPPLRFRRARFCFAATPFGAAAPVSVSPPPRLVSPRPVPSSAPPRPVFGPTQFFRAAPVSVSAPPSSFGPCRFLSRRRQHGTPAARPESGRARFRFGVADLGDGA
jgi:hypothetical protein